MQRVGGLVERRLCWLTVFTILLLASTAVPVFAESEPAPEAALSPASNEEALGSPDPLAVQAALKESEQEEEARERWLKSAEAKQEREESRLVARSTRWTPTANGDGFARGGYWVKFDRPAIRGDSGAPVWAGGSKASIGLVKAGRPEGSLTETLVEPLLHPPNLASNQVVGILHNPHMAPLSLKLGR